MALLSSQEELDTLLSRSHTGVVDWQLSREFALMALDDFIELKRFPSHSTLWELPIVIYNQEGLVRYYEFRILSNGTLIGAIAGNAQESLGPPIAHIFGMKGYEDELNSLYASDALNSDDLPRII